MPQPLSRVHPNPKIEMYASAIGNSPFAADAMRVIACWSQIEAEFSSLLARMLKADVEAGVAMYHSLVSSEAKKAAISAAAATALPEWQKILLMAVQKVTKPSRDQRNEFAHGVWGVAKQIPDAVLLVPSKFFAYRGGGFVEPKNYSKVMVYKRDDFVRASQDALNAQGLNGLLFLTIGDTIEQARRQLLNDRLVQQALQPLIRESSPLVQAILRPPKDGEPPPRGLYESWDRGFWAKVDRSETPPTA